MMELIKTCLNTIKDTEWPSSTEWLVSDNVPTVSLWFFLKPMHDHNHLKLIQILSRKVCKTKNDIFNKKCKLKNSSHFAFMFGCFLFVYLKVNLFSLIMHSTHLCECIYWLWIYDYKKEQSE